MSRFDRREWQRPSPPFPEREKPQKKRSGDKPWKVETRYTEQTVEDWPRMSNGALDMQRKVRMRRWGTLARYRTEADARKGLATFRKNRSILRDAYEYRLVGPSGAVAVE